MQLHSLTNKMGRAKKKFHNRPSTQAIFSEAPIGRSVSQVPQRSLSQTAGETETRGKPHEVQVLTDNLPQTATEQSAQTLVLYNIKGDELESEGILLARSLFRDLQLKAKDDKPLILAKFDQYDQYEEELDSCFKEFARLAESYVRKKREELTAALATSQDTTKPLAIRTEARLRGTQLMLAIRMEAVDLGVCMAQLFNVRKMFCWTVFGYNRVRIDRAARHGIQLKEEPTGMLTQINNDSRTTAAEDNKKDKKEKAPREPDLTALLSKYDQNVAQILKDVQAISNSYKEEKVKMPCLPELTLFFNPGVTVDLPKHILQSLSDILFVLDQMKDVRPDTITQRDILCKSLMAWRAVDKEFWERSKKTLDQNPVAAKYEHLRCSFLALFVTWSQEEAKAYDYFHEHDLLEKVEPAMMKRLGWQPSGWRRSRRGDRTAEEAWESHFNHMKDILPSVENLMIQCEEHWDKLTKSGEASATAQHGDWWKVLVPRVA